MGLTCDVPASTSSGLAVFPVSLKDKLSSSFPEECYWCGTYKSQWWLTVASVFKWHGHRCEGKRNTHEELKGHFLSLSPPRVFSRHWGGEKSPQRGKLLTTAQSLRLPAEKIGYSNRAIARRYTCLSHGHVHFPELIKKSYGSSPTPRDTWSGNQS